MKTDSCNHCVYAKQAGTSVGCNAPDEIPSNICEDGGYYKEFAYKCSCGWVGTEEQMDADYMNSNEEGEIWSNWICPRCEEWNSLEDYEILKGRFL